MRRYGIFALACFTAILLSSELALSAPILGIGPDLLIIVVVGFASGEQPRNAAVAGFVAGLVRDLLLTTPVGLSAFAYALTAYAAALVGAARGVWAVVALIAGATFLSQVVYGIGMILLGTQVDPGPLPRVVAITTLYNAVLSPLVVPLLRRIVPAESAGGAE